MVAHYHEVTYDYGVEKGPWIGMVPTKDQGRAKTFQDGFGVNMRGDMTEQCNIYCVPKMEDDGKKIGWAGPAEIAGRGQFVPSSEKSYEDFVKEIREMEKKGESVYFIRRMPGVPLSGGTIWVFNYTGELRTELAVNAGDLINGTQIDMDGSVYFVTARPRMLSRSQYFLEVEGGIFGVTDDKHNKFPFTGTLIKTKPKSRCTILLASAVVPLDQLPERQPDVVQIDFPNAGYSKNNWCWVEGAEWLYAGASPIVSTGCSCPSQRLCVDWYKRVFVPESYRHSIGALDTKGNLIMHIGSYGNFDSASGDKSRIPVSGGIGLSMVRFVSVTDNYLCFEDHGERLVVVKLDYHAEEAVGTKE